MSGGDSLPAKRQTAMVDPEPPPIAVFLCPDRWASVIQTDLSGGIFIDDKNLCANTYDIT